MKRIYSVGEVVLAAVLLLMTALYVLSEIPKGAARPSSPSASTETSSAISEALTEAPSQSIPETNTGQASSPVDFAETPADVLEKEQAVLALYASAEPKGTVQEVFYEMQGVTDSVGNVRVKNATHTKKPDFAALLSAGGAPEIADPTKPTVLIFHTHTSEAYLGAATGSFYSKEASRSQDPDESVVRVGTELAAVLEANGVGVIHDTNVYDDVYTGAYARSRESVAKYLEDYPSLVVTLDVHRDATYNSDVSAIKPTAVVDGKKAAQIMIITGAEEGDVTSFPAWETNLRFALALQKAAEDRFPGLMRPVFFCQRRYNMDMTPYSLLLEVGSDTNTLAEAVYSGRMIGQALADVLMPES